MATKLQTAETIFSAALEKRDLAERAAYLDEACGQNADLRAKVEKLLAAHPGIGDFLLEPMLGRDETIELPVLLERPGSNIGHYKLLQQIGEGGFGVVYMAEQLQPVRRKVALKIIKPGLDSRAIVARFEAERQALALMDHPNIARVLDAGATETGRPYFVMDLVKGVPLTEYCDKNRLGTRGRLALFATVCNAVQHAHQKGVIHRDLKPANIMVTLHDGKPVPKVIDFGVSKAISQQLTEKTLFTAYGQMVGTPQYMSPEQAEMSGLDIDTRSDIYSLGVLLYELLTGITPLDGHRLRAAGFAEIQRLVCHEEPSKPSTRLSTLGDELTVIARHRSVEPKRLRQQIQGDLDWIVMKSLEKERGRRYDSASRLADDIQRFLADEAVDARPPSTSYKLRKFVRRNKGPVAAAVLVLFVLCAGIIGTSIGLVRADAEAERANQAVAGHKAARLHAERMEATAKGEAERHRELSYRSDMNSALHVWQSGDAGRAAELLRRHLPLPDKPDLRGFEWYYLFGLCQRSVMTPLIRCKGGAVAYSPDGKRMAYSDGSNVKLQELATGMTTELVDREDGGLRVKDVAFSPSGQLLASSTADTVVLWNVESATRQRYFANGDGGAVQFSPDGTVLASTSWHGRRTKFWDIQTGRELAVFQHDAHVKHVAFCESDAVVVSDWQGNIMLWDLATKELRFRTKAHAGPASCVVSWLDTGRVASSGVDGLVKIWSTSGGKFGLVATLHGHSGNVESLAISPDGKTLASGGVDNTVRLWDVDSHQELDTLRGDSPLQTLAFAPDGKTLAAANYVGVRLWDTARPRPMKALAGHTRQLFTAAFSPDQTTMSTCGYDGIVRLWDTNTWSLRTKLAHEGPVMWAPFSPDGKMLATAGHEGVIRLWNLEDTKKPLAVFRATRGWVNSLAFSPDGKILASGDASWRSGAVKFWDLTALHEIESFRYEHPSGLAKAVFSPDGSHMASVTHGGTIRLWEIESRKERVLTGGAKDSWALEFSSDGKKLVAKAGTRVMLLDVTTGNELTFGNHPLLRTVSFMPEEKTIGTTGYDGTFRLWDPAANAPRFTFPNWGTGVNSFAASPDGKLIALCCRDAKVRLLHAATEADVRAAGWYEEAE